MNYSQILIKYVLCVRLGIFVCESVNTHENTHSHVYIFMYLHLYIYISIYYMYTLYKRTFIHSYTAYAGAYHFFFTPGSVT